MTCSTISNLRQFSSYVYKYLFHPWTTWPISLIFKLSLTIWGSFQFQFYCTDFTLLGWSFCRQTTFCPTCIILANSKTSQPSTVPSFFFLFFFTSANSSNRQKTNNFFFMKINNVILSTKTSVTTHCSLNFFFSSKNWLTTFFITNFYYQRRTIQSSTQCYTFRFLAIFSTTFRTNRLGGRLFSRVVNLQIKMLRAFLSTSVTLVNFRNFQ